MVFSMEVTDTESIKKEIIEQVKPVPEEVTKIKELAENNVSEIMTIDFESLEKRRLILKSIEAFGMDTLRNSAKRNSLLQISVGNFSRMGDEGVQLQKAFLIYNEKLKILTPA